MEFQLTEIERALNLGLYYVALQASLALPDICGALQSDNGEASKQKYIAWYNTYAKEPGANSISGDDCYYFRCSCLHQGSTQHPRSSYSRILFLVPTGNGFIFHNNVINNALNIDINIFCRNIIKAVRDWTKKVENDENYKKNYEHLLKVYPNGLRPYIVGCPVIS